MNNGHLGEYLANDVNGPARPRNKLSGDRLMD
jgi:hypothetical protein